MEHNYPSPPTGDVVTASRLKALPRMGAEGFGNECLSGWRGRDPLFPVPSCPGFNAITTHPRLWSVLGQLLGGSAFVRYFLEFFNRKCRGRTFP